MRSHSLSPSSSDFSSSASSDAEPDPKRRCSPASSPSSMPSSPQELVTHALQVSSGRLLDDFPPLKAFKCDGMSDVRVSLHTPDSLPRQHKAPMFRLLKSNMEQLYRLNWGWHEKAKRTELFSPEARYLVALDRTDKLVGFLHFRFIYDCEDEEPPAALLYIYEIQLHSDCQRRGLGRELMALLEELGRHLRMTKMKLTVFRNNTAALKLYTRLRYRVDASSPSEWGLEEECYEILSKPL